jgi:microcystin-dependent protein
MPVTINGTTGIAGPDGSAGTPAVQGTDTNTGIFFPAADTIAFGEGGAEAMRIDNGGNLVIGNTTALAKLDIGPVNSADEGAEIRFRGSTNATMDYFIDVFQSALRFVKADKGAATNAAVRFQIGESGQFGVGGAGYGTSGQVLTSGGASAAPSWQTVSAVPSGSVMAYAGSAAPSGWLLAFGQAVSRTTYADLFTAIGTTYGTGDGSTTFNLPDLRGRAVRGVDNMGGTAANRVTSGGSGITGTTLGASGGAETVTLTTAQMPAHNHAFNNLTFRYGTTGTGGSFGTVVDGGGSSRTGTANDSIGNTGTGGAHNNTGPTIMLNYIIKT